MKWKDKLWKLMSEYIRLRDADWRGNVKCISCGKTYNYKQVHAGHYFPRTSGNELYFYENNIHGQCIYCNLHLHGNLHWYRKNLIEKIGQAELDNMEQMAIRAKCGKGIKISDSEYEQTYNYYKVAIKQYESKRT